MNSSVERNRGLLVPIAYAGLICFFIYTLEEIIPNVYTSNKRPPHPKLFDMIVFIIEARKIIIQINL